ncbi:hypothetical protein N7489_001398 [Penicillium chrysogenum]|uniref:Uncharacterized protein n=1 Tax=Penicillium chrysogenum TaxID=5076 RepID=A0ABQ8WIJ4_PENCH|nr:uncharacterized protein N7489_001398 [Penicillium chrysogenum]XP_061068621.1 uncharacterized protein N7525_007752 [Penicillium rubens]KAJ5250988.1 hypothetical protein N7489_001398 [Penicillium chrysogenum]KAJ5262426.1 hypothetical protein N7524_007731 [Penicillium chrysogenum]KAJ5269888.1 hypothetical protein N7505_005646 [Penicillium chrysogenum]KAJ5829499.1 hypothetical protein N7525_007752 [Penicillium rubens]KAJ5852837.1 hypothetical protein N7534_005380 [Penicillium rubens]
MTPTFLKARQKPGHSRSCGERLSPASSGPPHQTIYSNVESGALFRWSTAPATAGAELPAG